MGEEKLTALVGTLQTLTRVPFSPIVFGTARKAHFAAGGKIIEKNTSWKRGGKEKGEGVIWVPACPNKNTKKKRRVRG